jgi:disulfide bond formation protein DsbB
MRSRLSTRTLCAAVAATALGAVAAALFTQIQWGMLPCPWCVLQRAIFVAIALAALPGIVLGRPGRWASGPLMLVLAACGVATALWQHFVAAASASCNLTLADRIVRGLGLDELWPQAFTPLVSCADGAVRLLGVPYEFYSLSLFVLMAAAAAWVLRRG